MDNIKDSKFIYEILVISDISVDNREAKITFETRNNKKYKFVFNNVWDLRYTIENASLDREFEGYKNRTSDISIVENSSYIELYKRSTLDGVYPKLVGNSSHYYITDFTDTIVDILTTAEPTIEKIDDEKCENDKLKQENEQLKWWKDNENPDELRKEFEELRAFKADYDKKEEQKRIKAEKDPFAKFR